MAANTSPPACLNCAAPFVPERRFYCPECGQETRPTPPTLRDLVLLLARLTGSVAPVAGVDDAKLTASWGAAQPTVRLNFYGRAVGLKDGVFFCDGLPAPVCQRFRTVIQTDPPACGVRLRAVNDRVVGNWGLVMFLLLPVFTLGLKVIYRNRRLAYTEHLVHALHLHTFWFCVLAVMLVRVTWVSVAGVLLMAVYTLMAGRRVYGGRWGPRLVRGLTLALLYTLLFVLAVPLSLMVPVLV